MNTPSVPPTRPISRFHVSLQQMFVLTTVMACSTIPILFWGWAGILLSVWLAVVGTALVFEQLLVAGCLIAFGIICSLGVDLPSVRREDSIVANNVGFIVAAIVALLVVAAAMIVWFFQSTPLGIGKAMKSLWHQKDEGLGSSQFSLHRLFGTVTVLCVSSAAISQFEEFPFLLAASLMMTGMLIVFHQYRLALLSSLAIPFVFRIPELI